MAVWVLESKDEEGKDTEIRLTGPWERVGDYVATDSFRFLAQLNLNLPINATLYAIGVFNRDREKDGAFNLNVG